MSKFKIGDRVRIVGANILVKTKYIGKEFIISDYEGERDGEPSWSGGSNTSPYLWRESELELATPSSPVRTVERKEIVPGEYGKVLVDRTANEGRLVVLGFQTGGNIFPPARSIMSAEDLTAAIATLTTIRDALREVAA